MRVVNVPFCDHCVALRRSKSARQITFERIATVNSILLALAVGVRVCVSACEELSRVVSAGRAPAIGTLVSMPAHGDRVWLWGLLLGALSALIVFGVMYLIVPPWSRRFRSPATQAALRAVTIVEYDWETTTLEFADGEYADRFALVNQQEG